MLSHNMYIIMCLLLYFPSLTEAEPVSDDNRIDSSVVKNIGEGEQLNSKCMEYTRVNPAIYLVHINCFGDDYIINLKELYSKGWYVYFSKSVSQDTNNINYTLFENSVTEKSEATYLKKVNFAPSIDGATLLPDKTHFRSGKLFNGWLIEHNLIKYLSGLTKIDNGYSMYIVYYGEILRMFWKEIKIILIMVGLVFLIVFIVVKQLRKRSNKPIF